MSVQSLNLQYACEMRSEELMYLGKAFKYLFHIFLKVLLKYAISFINYKALQNYRDTQSKLDRGSISHGILAFMTMNNVFHFGNSLW